MFIKPWERALRDGEPQGGGGGGAFDPAKFKSELLAEVSGLLKVSLADLAKQLKPPEPKPDGKPPEPKPDGKDEGGKPADPALAAMQAQMREMQSKLEAAEKQRQDAITASEQRERTSAIRAKLGDFQFASDAARESALRILDGDIVRGEDGNLYGPDKTTPFDKHIAKALEETHDYLLKPKDVGGSGAHNAGGKRTPPVDLNDIKPGMSAEDRQRVLAEIAQVGR
jgi:hypothetical protein